MSETVINKTQEDLSFRSTTPTVSIQTPSPEDLNGKSEFFLLCLVTGFYPEEIYIMWEVNGGKYEEGITGEPLKTGDKYSVTSLFRVSKVDWDNGNRLICFAYNHILPRHASLPQTQEYSVQTLCTLPQCSSLCPAAMKLLPALLTLTALALSGPCLSPLCLSFSLHVSLCSSKSLLYLFIYRCEGSDCTD
uniref:Ig-like domain-containing protein n=1 Tax=Paramormyrops kingsleyae TaxID=1676925 RepID=A0A3B3SXC0_9TELE